MEFEELIHLNSADDILEELNRYPEEYFNKYNAEQHIIANDDILTERSDCNTGRCMCFDNCYFYFVSRSNGSGINPNVILSRWYKFECQ